MQHKDVWNIGFYSSLCTTLFALIYIIPQLIIGIDMPETKKDQFLILLPSLFLAPSFLIMMVSVHYLADPARRIWSHIGIVFAHGLFCIRQYSLFYSIDSDLTAYLKGR
jgi:hypothetical protein